MLENGDIGVRCGCLSFSAGVLTAGVTGGPWRPEAVRDCPAWSQARMVQLFCEHGGSAPPCGSMFLVFRADCRGAQNPGVSLSCGANCYKPASGRLSGFLLISHPVPADFYQASC